MAARPPAPGDLELVREFANTLDIESGFDELDSPDAMDAWYEKAGLIPTAGQPSAPADLEEARAVREALRKLLLANHGEPLDAQAVETLNRALQSLPLVPRLAAGPTPALEATGSGPRAALARLLAIAFGAMAEATWSRLKICRSDACQWAYYDHSRNRSGSWCSMAVCGNRTKVRAYQQRAKARAAKGEAAP